LEYINDIINTNRGSSQAGHFSRSRQHQLAATSRHALLVECWTHLHFATDVLLQRLMLQGSMCVRLVLVLKLQYLF